MFDLIYRQKTGELADATSGLALGFCYSGRSAGLNNPELQDLQHTGPIPQGIYRLGADGPLVGGVAPLVFPLTPLAGNTMHGRRGFQIRPDNAERNHTASDGSIVATRPIRELVAMYVGGLLVVISGYALAADHPQTPANPATENAP